MESKKEKTTKNIEIALMELLNETNFEKISVGDIADKAGICRSTFYKYFVDKFEVVEHLQKYYANEIVTRSLTYADTLGIAGITDVTAYLKSNEKIIKQLMGISTVYGGLPGEYKACIVKSIQNEAKGYSQTEIKIYASIMAERFSDTMNSNYFSASTRDFFVSIANIVFMFMDLPHKEKIRKELLCDIDLLCEDIDRRAKIRKKEADKLLKK